jgi:LysR family glycine cleavage system transcriptional activator
MTSLPPLAAIRAFEAVARHLSFTKAADELGMTQAAVSYQIKLLEERLGAPLFLRRPRQIALSEAGARLAPEVTKAFAMLRQAFVDVHGRADGMLSISAVPTFASQWLAANLGLFQIGHPEVAVRIESSPVIIDFAETEIDVAIRSVKAVKAGLVAHQLTKVEYAPMVHPRLLEEHNVREPADLLKIPQITPDDPWVAAWFKRAGVTDLPPLDRPFARLGYQSMEASAVMAGRGVAMLTPQFYPEEIRAGRLVQPFDLVGWDGDYYFLVYPEARRNAPKIRAFRDWIVDATAGLRALEASNDTA